jgi:hypothetical protein
MTATHKTFIVYPHETNVMWVTDDGSYGTGEVLIIDTTNWTDAELEQVSDASDNERIEIAYQIALSKESN